MEFSSAAEYIVIIFWFLDMRALLKGPAFLKCKISYAFQLQLSEYRCAPLTSYSAVPLAKRDLVLFRRPDPEHVHVSMQREKEHNKALRVL